MAASAKYNSPQRGADPIPNRMTLPVYQSTKIYGGTMVAINSSGYAVPAASTPGLRVIGRAEDTVDNSSGSSGDLKVNVLRGTFRFANSSSTGALAATNGDIGKQCYVSDDITVTRLSTGGTTPIAGRVIDIDSNGVWVDLLGTNEPSIVDLFMVAGADLSSSQYLFMKNSSGNAVANDTAGGDCLGILQNAPASSAIAIIRAQGPSRAIASGSINANTRLKSDNAGKTAATAAGTVSGSNTVGSYTMALALTAGTSGNQHSVLVQPMGLVPTTVG